MLGCVHSYDRAYIFLKIIRSVFDALLSIPLLILPGVLIDVLTQGREVEEIAAVVSAIVLIPLVRFILMSISDRVLKRRYLRLQTLIYVDYYHTVATMDYDLFDDPEIGKRRARSFETVFDAALSVDRIEGMISALIQVFMIVSVVAAMDAAVVFVALAVIAVNMVISKRESAAKYEYDNENICRSVRAGMLGSVLTSGFYASEVRAYDCSDYFAERYRSEQERSDELQISYKRGERFNGFLRQISSLLQNAVTYIFAIYRILYLGYSVGSLTVCLSSITQFTSVINTLVNTYLAAERSGRQIEEYREFIEMPRRMLSGREKNIEWREGAKIEFKNVYFKYLRGEKYVLENFSLCIEYGQTLCIVGDNGMGKSTFVKLLFGLYPIESGEILLCGRSIFEYDYAEYVKLFSAIFQEYVLYNVSVKDNIVLETHYDAERYDEALKRSRLSEVLDRFPKRDDSMMFKSLEEDGVFPSGGECQRMVLARALYRGGKIYILDEPTAYLDPDTEYEVYKQFHGLIKGKTALLITHRLSAVQLADKIAVFADGHVEEYGTHAELYARGGMYREMFDKQSEFYVKANEKE